MGASWDSDFQDFEEAYQAATNIDSLSKGDNNEDLSEDDSITNNPDEAPGIHPQQPAIMSAPATGPSPLGAPPPPPFVGVTPVMGGTVQLTAHELTVWTDRIPKSAWSGLDTTATGFHHCSQPAASSVCW